MYTYNIHTIKFIIIDRCLEACVNTTDWLEISNNSYRRTCVEWLLIAVISILVAY